MSGTRGNGPSRNPEQAVDNRSAGRYLTSRSDLADWHYGWCRDHNGRIDFDARKPHANNWKLSSAWTHCLCFGAMARAVDPLLAEIDRLKSELFDAQRLAYTKCRTCWDEMYLRVGKPCPDCNGEQDPTEEIPMSNDTGLTREKVLQAAFDAAVAQHNAHALLDLARELDREVPDAE